MDTMISEKVISYDGTSIAYYRSGEGQPLLLVHGTSADHRRWSGVLSYFESHFTVFNMNRRGRGGSGDSPDYHVLREAEDVASVVEAIYQQVGEPVSVLGHSFGGVCSLEASLLSSKLNKLILYEPPLPVGQKLYTPDLPDRMQALIEDGQWEAALETFFRTEVKMPEHELALFRQLPMWKERIKAVPTVLREIVIDRAYRFEAEKFADFQVPTLLLLGGDSPPIFRQAVETLHSVLPNNRVVILPGQKHIAMDTNPELFVKAVLEFLQQ